MINSLSSTNLLQNYAVKSAAEQPKAEVVNTLEQPKIAQDIVKKETADATKAYAAGIVKPKAASEKKSLDEFKTDLIAQGKIEGKDFTVRKGELDSQLNIMENDKTVKVLRFDKDGAKKENFEAVQEFSYPVGDGKGLKQIETTYGADGEFHFRSFRYEKENSPYQNDIVNFETKPFELEQKLKADGVKIARDVAYGESVYTTKITAFDPKTDNMTRYEFSYKIDDETPVSVEKCIIGKDGLLQARLLFREDETSYTEFKDSLKA